MTPNEIIGRSKVYTDAEMRDQMGGWTKAQLVTAVIALVRNNEKMIAVLAQRWTVTPTGEIQP